MSLLRQKLDAEAASARPRVLRQLWSEIDIFELVFRLLRVLASPRLSTNLWKQTEAGGEAHCDHVLYFQTISAGLNRAAHQWTEHWKEQPPLRCIPCACGAAVVCLLPKCRHRTNKGQLNASLVSTVTQDKTTASSLSPWQAAVSIRLSRSPSPCSSISSGQHHTQPLHCIDFATRTSERLSRPSSVLGTTTQVRRHAPPWPPFWKTPIAAASFASRASWASSSPCKQAPSVSCHQNDCRCGNAPAHPPAADSDTQAVSSSSAC